MEDINAVLRNTIEVRKNGQAVLQQHQMCRSDWLAAKTGVKQGCVMSGFLFLLVIGTGLCAGPLSKETQGFDGK